MLLGSFTSDKSYKITAKLVKIEYFSKCDCGENSPILARVSYSVNGNLNNLKMKHTFLNGISVTNPIKELDKRGNVIYSFCIPPNEKKEFITTFINSQGEQSSAIKVSVYASDNIILGTAPKTVSLP